MTLIGLRGAVGLATLAVVAGSLVPTFAASSAAADGAPAHNPRGQFLGVLPSRNNAANPSVATSPHLNTLVTYHGGPVQHSSAVYAIFWKPPGATFPAGYAVKVAQYFTDVAHDSFTAGNPYGSDTGYFDGSGVTRRFVSYSVTAKAAIVDTLPYPANGCPNYPLLDGTTSTKCLTNAQIVTKIKSVITAHAFPTGLASQYFLFLPQGVATCFTATSLASGGCYDPSSAQGYCAYHSFSGTGAQAVLYADMQYAAVTGCDSGQSPQGNAADAVINGISHEHQETMTDPLGTAWYDINGAEIADKCAFTFGLPLGFNSFGQFNEVINTHDYWLQEIWSNRAQACVQRNTFHQPTASFTFAPAAPLHGTPVAFHSTSHSGDGTALTYRWTFPTGAISTVPSPTFTFPTAGAQNVTLVVFDTHGDQSKVTRTVTVH
jgi:hypothetical protein